jgi:dihydrofolate reductase
MNRPQTSVYIASSLDGYIAREDGALDWLDQVALPNEDYGFKAFLAGIDCVIMGRKTFDVASTAYGTSVWPYQGKRLIVLSQSVKTPLAEVFHGEFDSLLLQLKKEGINHIWVDGGTVISQFLRQGLIDKIIVSVIPLLLGSGIRLFDIGTEVPCQLLTAKSYESGLVQLHYKIRSTDGI